MAGEAHDSPGDSVDEAHPGAAVERRSGIELVQPEIGGQIQSAAMADDLMNRLGGQAASRVKIVSGPVPRGRSRYSGKATGRRRDLRGWL